MKIPNRKIMFKQTTDLNIKAKTLKCLEEIIGDYFYNLRLDKMH